VGTGESANLAWNAVERPRHAEAELIREAKRRSPQAWSAIYNAHYGQLYRYCYARCRNEWVASDLASSVFLEALEGIDRFMYRGRPLLAWLYRIARNLVSDYLEARGREATAVGELAILMESHTRSPASEASARADVENALRQLTDDQRQIVELRFFVGLTTSEIAEVLGRNEAAVYSLEVRAIVTARRFLNGGEAARGPRRRKRSKPIEDKK
jgi:RNA polymerase sigma-70 factor (ECF subfamily)